MLRSFFFPQILIKFKSHVCLKHVKFSRENGCSPTAKECLIQISNKEKLNRSEIISVTNLKTKAYSL